MKWQEENELLCYTQHTTNSDDDAMRNFSERRKDKRHCKGTQFPVLHYLQVYLTSLQNRQSVDWRRRRTDCVAITCWTRLETNSFCRKTDREPLFSYSHDDVHIMGGLPSLQWNMTPNYNTLKRTLNLMLCWDSSFSPSLISLFSLPVVQLLVRCSCC